MQSSRTNFQSARTIALTLAILYLARSKPTYQASTVQAGIVTVHAKPYEIKTVKIRFTLPAIPGQVQMAK